MKTIDVAIIIPTLNEELFIGKLLDSLASQTVLPKEVIVVDATSQDKTKYEVEKRTKYFPSLSFFAIPKDTIAKQRNFGVAKSTASHLLFLDADMQLLTKETLEQLWGKIQDKNPDVAICYIMPLSDELKDKILSISGNALATVLQPVKPIGTTMNLYVKRSVFDALHGFNEKVRVAEDFEFISRMAKAEYVFKVFMRPIFYTSVRRFAYEGRKKYIAKLFKSMLYIQRYGHVKNPIEYDFGKFQEEV